jgi:hypothetical protein
MLIVDQEQAELIDAAVEMMHAALTARARRVDPGRVISDSITLQAHKLATVRRFLSQGAPYRWADLPDALKAKARAAVRVLADATPGADQEKAWENLRGLTNSNPMD